MTRKAKNPGTGDAIITAMPQSKRQKTATPQETDFVMWGRRKFEFQMGVPENARDFELVRLLRRVEELEAEKRNLLANLSAVKRVLQDHQQMWLLGFRESHWPTHGEANSLKLGIESAIGRLDQLSNGRNSFALLPENHPWLREK